MRLLHAGVYAFCDATPGCKREPKSEADSQGDCGKYLPLHRLSEHFQGDRNRRGKNSEIQPWRLSLGATSKCSALPRKCLSSLRTRASSVRCSRILKGWMIWICTTSRYWSWTAT